MDHPRLAIFLKFLIFLATAPWIGLGTTRGPWWLLVEMLKFSYYFSDVFPPSFYFFCLFFSLFSLFFEFFFFLEKTQKHYTQPKKRKTRKGQNFDCLPTSAFLGSRARPSLLGGLRMTKIVDSKLVNCFPT